MTSLNSLSSPPIAMLRVTFLMALLVFAGVAHAALPATIQTQVDDALAKLSGWAGEPEVVAAVKSANSSPGGAMTNGKWVELGADAPQVVAITSSSLSKQLSEWQNSTNLNKLFLRAKTGELVAGSKKPLVYNVKKRPPFKKAITGSPWHAGKAKPDPTTQIKSVQISVPVKDGGDTIGVLHSAVTVQ